MARTPAETLTGREAQVMDAVWRLGAGTALQVRQALPATLHDSTVRTLLRVLETKGYVVHESREKAYIYKAIIARGRRRAACSAAFSPASSADRRKTWFSG